MNWVSTFFSKEHFISECMYSKLKYSERDYAYTDNIFLMNLDKWLISFIVVLMDKKVFNGHFATTLDVKN